MVVSEAFPLRRLDSIVLGEACPLQRLELIVLAESYPEVCDVHLEMFQSFELRGEEWADEHSIVGYDTQVSDGSTLFGYQLLLQEGCGP